MPGSVKVPVIDTAVLTSTGSVGPVREVIVGGILFTITVSISVPTPPSSSVTLSPTMKEPSSSNTILGLTPVASSYCPSLSKSHS